ncbi:hypothetical protein ACGFWI_27310 [Streptomyces sp. NPDC048434]|uniref:hypothetical protein n=1 Tax=Streptomyces sp. NPDC048434 TaxID=3365549 RepID=UPI00371C44AB
MKILHEAASEPERTTERRPGCLDQLMLAIASDAFYTSGTFWAAASAVAAICMGGGAMWATLRASNPKRRIDFWMRDTPLLRDHQSLNGTLEVRRNGSVLVDPRLVRVQLRNPSRRDVSSTAFDQGEPLRMNLGVPILDILGVEAQPSTAQAPPATASGAELRVGPGRFGRGSRITYLVLIDGTPSYSCQHSLIDVDVVEDDALGYDPRAARVIAALTAATAAFTVFSLLTKWLS